MSKKKSKSEEGFEEIDSDFNESEQNEKEKNKTNQNYLAAIILLAALLIGSIFVDITDLIRGEGISKKKLANQDLFEYAGKTWVAYNDPAVELVIVNDEECEECKTESAVLGLKSAIPTVVPREISTRSEEGKKLLSKASSKTIPVFLFADKIEKTEVFPKIQNVLTKKDNLYMLDISVLGINGKYTEIPPFESKNQEVFGNPEAKVTIIEFSDFQCPYCKLFYESLDKLMKEGDYKNKVKVAFKHLPLSFHQKSNDAAMAASCAGEQNKFWDMYSLLFSKQEEWQNAQNNDRFKAYASQLKLDSAKFNACLDGNKLQSDIDADKNLAKDFNISGTPAIFINDEYISGAIQYDELKAKIDALLSK